MHGMGHYKIISAQKANIVKNNLVIFPLKMEILRRNMSG